MLFCADCGHVMYQQRYQNKNRKQDCYICGSYKKRTRDCTAHFIRTDLLTAGVLSNLRQVTEYAAKHESRFVKLLIQQNEIGGKRKTAAATKQLEQAQERISEISRMIKRLYEDNVNGKISDERFMELSADYEQEQRELKDRAAALQAELDKSQAATVNAEKFMGIVRKHLAFEELTPTLLREMIEKIVVHECSYDENGTRRQDIEIYYRTSCWRNWLPMASTKICPSLPSPQPPRKRRCRCLASGTKTGNTTPFMCTPCARPLRKGSFWMC